MTAPSTNAAAARTTLLSPLPLLFEASHKKARQSIDRHRNIYLYGADNDDNADVNVKGAPG